MTYDCTNHAKSMQFAASDAPNSHPDSGQKEAPATIAGAVIERLPGSTPGLLKFELFRIPCYPSQRILLCDPIYRKHPVDVTQHHIGSAVVILDTAKTAVGLLK